ncbi:MAG: NAD(P)H-dependent oxidoreductase subunit E [Desulfobacterales bacterium]
MEFALQRAEADRLARLRAQWGKAHPNRRQLIPLLQQIQNELAYLPPDALVMVAEYLDLSPSEVYGVASFYNQFRFKPPGKYPIKVCLGTACHVKGAGIILENFERKLGIKEGETTPDREFSIERVACVGCCALAPVAQVGENIQGHMAPSKVEGVFTRIEVDKQIQARQDRPTKALCHESDLGT